MSLTDAEIMGGIGFGDDLFQPIRQEPMGFNYGSQTGLPRGRTETDPDTYIYSDYDTHSRFASAHNGIEDPPHFVDGELNDEYLSNKDAVETYFQNQNVMRGETRNLRRSEQMSNKHKRGISYSDVKEKLTDAVSVVTDAARQNSQLFMLFILMIVLFVIVAQMQQSQIKHLQSMLTSVLIRNSQTTKST